MTVLVLGDVVGDAGCDYLQQKLPALKKEHAIDVVIANGENASEGNGLLPSSAYHLWDSGVDVITLGNHGLRRREVYDLLESDYGLIRPANYHPDAPGSGVFIYDNLTFQLAVVNLQGQVYMQGSRCPFDAVDRLLEEIPTDNIVVDFHAEATSEKICMGYHLDGRVSAVVGTHTHVPTADAHILPEGTGYITDLGMCGARHSVLGVQTPQALYRMRTGLPTRFYNEKEDIRLSGVLLEINEKTGKCEKIQQLAFM